MEKGEWCAGEGVRGEVVEVVDGVGEEVSGAVSIPCPFQWPHSPFARGQDLSAHRSVVSTKSGPK